MINLEFLPDLQHLLNSAKVEERKASSVNLNSVSMVVLGLSFYHFCLSITFVLFLSESETATSSFGSSMLSLVLLY